MTVLRLFTQHHAFKVLKLYSLFSLIAAGMFFVQDFIDHKGLHPDSFLVSLFFLGHLCFWFCTGLKGVENFCGRKKSYAASLFLFQILLLPMLSYQYRDPSYLFFAVIPCSASTFIELLSSNHRWHWSKMARTTYLTGIFCLLFLTLELSRYSLFADQTMKGVNLLIFMVWTQAMIGLAFSAMASMGTSPLKNQSSNEPISASIDQLFYHDMINLTHGLLLFLKQKNLDRAGVDSTDLSVVINEIESMQWCLKDHFKFGHKNLVKGKNLVPFSEARLGVYSIVHTYLIEQEIEAQILFQGYLNEDDPRCTQVMVHYPSLHRIFTNLIKNAHDHRAQSVEIIFHADENNLTLSVKNPVKKQLAPHQELEKSLGQLILATDFENHHESSGVGLESVQELAQSMNGHFECTIDDGFWVSTVTLAHPFEFEKTQQDNFQEDFKKVA